MSRPIQFIIAERLAALGIELTNIEFINGENYYHLDDNGLDRIISESAVMALCGISEPTEKDNQK